MARQPRHQSVISRQSDAEHSDDHWLRQFEDKLQKGAVTSRDPNLYEQINSIMNTKSKYPSVQAAVDDMMHRSGLTDYLDNVKTSKEDTTGKPRKTAQQNPDPKLPEVIQREAKHSTDLR